MKSNRGYIPLSTSVFLKSNFNPFVKMNPKRVIIIMKIRELIGLLAGGEHVRL